MFMLTGSTTMPATAFQVAAPASGQNTLGPLSAFETHAYTAAANMLAAEAL